jgi:hypothetical protein
MAARIPGNSAARRECELEWEWRLCCASGNRRRGSRRQGRQGAPNTEEHSRHGHGIATNNKRAAAKH